MNNTQNTTDVSKPTEKTYQLDCTSCSFEAVVEGDLDDAYDLIEQHESAYEDSDDDHFVDLETTGYET